MCKEKLVWKMDEARQCSICGGFVHRLNMYNHSPYMQGHLDCLQFERLRIEEESRKQIGDK